MVQTQTTGTQTPLTNAPIHAILPCNDLSACRDFYVNTLGLKEVNFNEGNDCTLEAGNCKLYLYNKPGTAPSDATVAGFTVQDVEGTVKKLKEHGVAFEEYDMPGLKTVNGVAKTGDWIAAWIKDPDGHIIAIGNN